MFRPKRAVVRIYIKYTTKQNSLFLHMEKKIEVQKNTDKEKYYQQ